MSTLEERKVEWPVDVWTSRDWEGLEKPPRDVLQECHAQVDRLKESGVEHKLFIHTWDMGLWHNVIIRAKEGA